MNKNCLQRIVGHPVSHRGLLRIVVLALALAVVAGCTPNWELPLSIDGIAQAPIASHQVRDWAELFDGEAREGALPLERVLYESGVEAIDALTVAGHTYAWPDICEQAWLLPNGRIEIDGQTLDGSQGLAIASPPELAQVTARIVDIAPTIATALGLPAPAQATGSAMTTARADHVVMIFLDGFGYRRYMEVRGQGLMPYLDGLDAPQTALTVYPSVTKMASAAMVTGAPPSINGARDRGDRSTKVETIFDVLAAHGMRGVAVEGNALSFNLRNADLILSGDRDGNGHSDDNTHANVMDVVAEGLPDFLWVHWHGIDDIGHSYGPQTPEEEAKLTKVDGYVAELVGALPTNTLVIVCADHGMHHVNEDERLGNHGTLAPLDMFTPMWVYTTE